MARLVYGFTTGGDDDEGPSAHTVDHPVRAAGLRGAMRLTTPPRMPRRVIALTVAALVALGLVAYFQFFAAAEVEERGSLVDSIRNPITLSDIEGGTAATLPEDMPTFVLPDQAELRFAQAYDSPEGTEFRADWFVAGSVADAIRLYRQIGDGRWTDFTPKAFTDADTHTFTDGDGVYTDARLAFFPEDGGVLLTLYLGRGDSSQAPAASAPVEAGVPDDAEPIDAGLPEAIPATLSPVDGELLAVADHNESIAIFRSSASVDELRDFYLMQLTELGLEPAEVEDPAGVVVTFELNGDAGYVGLEPGQMTTVYILVEGP